MADVITRLRVESSEYDNKLKRAVEQMNRMEQEVRRTGATFAVADKEELEFVRSLGQMQTKATSAKGQIAELKNAFTALSLQYKHLSDQEKQSPFGKAMEQSLDQLKSRINDANSEIKEVNQELGGGSGLSGVLDAVAGKIGIPVDMFSKLGVAAAGVGAALKVATDALKQNEEFMDEWGRVTSSAQSLYKGFLDALNTGDITGYLSRIDDIVQAARDAYDALDELGTFQAFNQINTQKALTQWTQAIADFREGSITKEQAKQFAEAYKDQLKAQQSLQQDVYDKAVIDMAQDRGVDPALLKEALSGTYGDYKALKELSMPTKSVWNSSTRSFNDVIDRDAATEQQLLGEMLRKLTDGELDALQKLGLQAEQTATQIASVDRTVVRMLGKGGKGAIVKPEEVLPAGSIAEIEKRISDLNNALKMAGDQTTRDNIRLQIQALKEELGMMNADLTMIDSTTIPLEVELAPTAAEVLTNEMDELRKRLGMEPIQLGVQVGTDGKGTVQTAKETEKAWGAAANAISNIGGALQQIEDPSAKVAGIVMQAVANIALGFAQAAASPATGAAGVFGWIAASTAGLATMLSTIAAIKSATAGSYASGGIIPGNSYSGDNLTANVNSGELILNRAQQSNLASQLEAGSLTNNLHLTTEISGTNLRIVLDNDNRSKGGSRGAYSRIK